MAEKKPEERKRRRERKPRTYMVFKKVDPKTLQFVGEFGGLRNVRHLVRKIRVGEVKLEPGEYVVITKKAVQTLPSAA